MKTAFVAAAAALLGAAALRAQYQVNLTVDATMDIYRAGGYNDGSNGIAPLEFSFPAGGWRTITFPSVSGVWTCQAGEPSYGADGETSGYCLIAGGATNFNSIGPFSGYHLTDFVGALAGVFLGDSLPTSPAPALRFYVSNNSGGGIQTNFLTLRPQIGQIFFIGDGLTGTGTGSIQTLYVPLTATHLYLGYVDNCQAPNNTMPGCYSDNVGSLNVVARVQYYVPDWVEPTLPVAPSTRADAGMAYDAATYSAVLFGGGNARLPNGMVYGDTWIWYSGWIQLSPAASPPARTAPGMAYDPTTRTVVLFGGRDSSGVALGDTWTWGGVTWTQQFPAVSPPARAPGHSMAYDSATGTVVLFGGGGNENSNYGSPVFGDTWEWDGRTRSWTQLLPPSGPSPRRAAALTYDPISRTVVLFAGDNGGGDCCGTYNNDTWSWDGASWTQLSPASSPPARTEQMMAYDAGLFQVVLYGGYSTPGQGLADTWAWNGRTWRQLRLGTQPSGRWGSAMAYDPLSSGLVLFGGELTGDMVTNNTWLFVPVPLP